MTLKELLDDLRKHHRGQFVVRENGTIRNAAPGGNMLCPIETVRARHAGHMDLWNLSALKHAEEDLGMKTREATWVIMAADKTGAPATRKKLLKALGLKEAR
jgi:hypothetical protein